MAANQQTSLKRLAKKLSALRATLSKDERVLLDRIVLGNQDVALHAATTGAAMGKKRAAMAANEVALHAATTGAALNAAALLEFDATTGGYRIKDAAAL